MIKLLIGGLWVCAVTAGTAFYVSTWQAGAASRAEEEFIDGLDYIKTRAINVPIIHEGRIEGYVITRLVFTVDARTLSRLSVPPEVFVIDEAFRAIYADEATDFDHLERFDLNVFADDVVARVNARLEAEIVQEVLIDRFDYFSAEDLKAQAAAGVPLSE